MSDYNPILDDDGEGNIFANDDDEVTNPPKKEFSWEYSDDEDSGSPEGVQEDGTTIHYDITMYVFSDLSLAVNKITMRITNQPGFPDRHIDRYMTYKERRKYEANGVTSPQQLFEHGEDRDDMEYFFRRLRAAESDGKNYTSPIEF